LLARVHGLFPSRPTVGQQATDLAFFVEDYLRLRKVHRVAHRVGALLFAPAAQSIPSLVAARVSRASVNFVTGAPDAHRRMAETDTSASQQSFDTSKPDSFRMRGRGAAEVEGALSGFVPVLAMGTSSRRS
jgi:hypothetical protein